MTFKDQLASDVSSVFFNADEFADAGSFTKFTSGAITADVPFIISVAASDTAQGYGVADMATISIPAAALSAAPERHDTITKGSVVYTLMQRLSADDDVYVFSVETEERHNPKQ